jgi:hypothetical protein
MASNPPRPPVDTGGQGAKAEAPKPKPGSANKPRGKPALKGPLDRPEKS